MPDENSDLLLCYNRGCGNKFDPKDNQEDSCTFHPGNPVFHDAYKGWSCCNKKCTDFTEFLNIKGCTTSFHSNVKPPEPEKPVIDKSKSDEIIEYKAPKPITVSSIERPPFDSPLTLMKPIIAGSLQSQMEGLIIQQPISLASNEIIIGTTCKNGGCKATYEGPQSSDDNCIFHPGTPIFHEGLKFWSCCTKRTTDFAAFLEQVGCTTGKHVWIKEKQGNVQPACRYDWHQTGSYVIISIYAKKYDPVKSTIELNPIRAKVHLFFPEDSCVFNLDLELRGVIDIEKSSVSMLSTKVEIKLKKAEPGSWSKLDFPKAKPLEQEKEKVVPKPAPEPLPDDDPVDLADIY